MSTPKLLLQDVYVIFIYEIFRTVTGTWPLHKGLINLSKNVALLPMNDFKNKSLFLLTLFVQCEPITIF